MLKQQIFEELWFTTGYHAGVLQENEHNFFPGCQVHLIMDFPKKGTILIS